MHAKNASHVSDLRRWWQTLLSCPFPFALHCDGFYFAVCSPLHPGLRCRAKRPVRLADCQNRAFKAPEVFQRKCNWGAASLPKDYRQAAPFLHAMCSLEAPSRANQLIRRRRLSVFFFNRRLDDCRWTRGPVIPRRRASTRSRVCVRELNLCQEHTVQLTIAV